MALDYGMFAFDIRYIFDYITDCYFSCNTTVDLMLNSLTLKWRLCLNTVTIQHLIDEFIDT